MKNYLIGMIAVVIMVLSGCKPEDYNLRVIRDSERNYISTDSTETRMRWLNDKWVMKNQSVWSSAGIIITNEYNLFDSTVDPFESIWLEKIIDDGFRGMIVLDLDVDTVPLEWENYRNVSFQNEWFDVVNADPDNFLRDTRSDNRIEVEINGEMCAFIDPAHFNIGNNISTELFSVLVDHIDLLTEKYNIDNVDISFGVAVANYNSLSYSPAEKYSIGNLIDPFELGKDVDEYTNTDLLYFDNYYDSIVALLYAEELYTIVAGDRLLLDVDYSMVGDGLIDGYMLPEVNTDNVGEMILYANYIRDAAPAPLSVNDSFLMIAGVQADEYNCDSTLDYGMMVRDLISAGIYFTPGAGNTGDTWFDYPNYLPGDWWYRVDNDSEWIDNPNNPNYTVLKYHPTNILPGVPGQPQVVHNDVDLNTLADDVIVAGLRPDGSVIWTSEIDFVDGTKFYFDPTAGPDGDGSLEDPFQDLETDINKIARYNSSYVKQNSGVVEPGDVAVLLAGNHGSVEFSEYYNTDWIGFVSLPGEIATVDFFDMAECEKFYLESIRGSERLRSDWPEPGVSYDDGPDVFSIRSNDAGTLYSNKIVLNKCSVQSANIPTAIAWADSATWNRNTVSGIRVYKANNVQIQLCDFNVVDDAIHGSNWNVLNLLSNDINYFNGDAFSLGNSDSLYAADNSIQNVIHTNTNHNDGIQLWGTFDTALVERNYFLWTTDIEREGWFDGSLFEHQAMLASNGPYVDLTFRNNVIITNSWAGINIYNCTDGKLINNTAVTIYSSDNLPASNIGYPHIEFSGALCVDCVVANNIAGKTDNDGQATVELYNNLDYSYNFRNVGFNSWMANGEPTTYHLTLASISSAINEGRSTDAPLVDFIGTCRPYGISIDIGAYEYDDGGECGFAMGENSIEYVMNQNGDRSDITVTIYTIEDSQISSASLRTEPSVDWLEPQTTADVSSPYPAKEHILVFPGDIQLWDTDQLVVTIHYADMSHLELYDTISWEPEPVTVVHDGYIAGGFAQTWLEALAPGEYYDMATWTGGVESWQEFGESYDTYLMPKQIIDEVTSQNSPNLIIDNILPYNPDFVPVFFLDFGFFTPNTHPGRWSNRVYERFFVNSSDFTLKDADGTYPRLDWGNGATNTNPYIHNPVSFEIDNGDTLWWFEVFAEMVSSSVSHSSNYVANMQLMFDWAQDSEWPWWDLVNRAENDLDNDGIRFKDDLFFSPGDPTELNRPWGDITVDEAYQIALRRFYTKLKSLKPDIPISYNGVFGCERPVGDSHDYMEGRLMERWRDRIASGHIYEHKDGWLYAPNWESFVYACGDYADLLREKTGLPWAPLHWDTRENITDPTVEEGEAQVPIVTNMGEGASLLSNGVQSFAYLDRDHPQYHDRYAWSLDDTTRAMDLGVPAGPMIVDSWGKAHRMWTKGSVWVEWMGDMQGPTPYAWTVLDAAGDTIRTRNHGRVPDLNNADFTFFYKDATSQSRPDEYFTVQDRSRVFVCTNNHGNSWVDGNYNPDVNNATQSHIAMSSSVLDEGDTGWPIGNDRIAMFTLGLDEVFDGQDIEQANLILSAGWTSTGSDYPIDLAAGDTIFFLGITDPTLGVWRNDLSFTSYNEPSPGETWGKEPNEWMISDFGAYAHLPGPLQLAEDDTVSVDITTLVQAASDNPDDWGGIVAVVRLHNASNQSIQNFNAPKNKEKIYITVTTSKIPDYTVSSGFFYFDSSLSWNVPSKMFIYDHNTQALLAESDVRTVSPITVDTWEEYVFSGDNIITLTPSQRVDVGIWGDSVIPASVGPSTVSYAYLTGFAGPDPTLPDPYGATNTSSIGPMGIYLTNSDGILLVGDDTEHNAAPYNVGSDRMTWLEAGNVVVTQ